MNPILSVQNLSFLDISYPDIDITEGAFTFISGESGCGKSTLLRLLNATALPLKGTIWYRGRQIREIHPVEYRRCVLLASQEFFLYEGSIRDNFALYYSCRGECCPEEAVIKKALHTCLAEFLPDAPCSTLSGGERQRVFLSLCLSFRPDVLLLDEPTSALDEKTAKDLFGSLLFFCRESGITPVTVCHSTRLTGQFAEHIIELKKGERV